MSANRAPRQQKPPSREATGLPDTSMPPHVIPPSTRIFQQVPSEVFPGGEGLQKQTASATGSAASPLTNKGDLWGFSTTNARIPIGSNGQVLTADSTQALGLKWATPASGTVTSVGLSLPSELTVSGSPVTGSGTLAAVWASQSASLFFAAPLAGGTPSFRAINNADLPASGVVSGSYTNANITVNSKGIITAASSGSAGGAQTWVVTLLSSGASVSPAADPTKVYVYTVRDGSTTTVTLPDPATHINAPLYFNAVLGGITVTRHAGEKIDGNTAGLSITTPHRQAIVSDGTDWTTISGN